MVFHNLMYSQGQFHEKALFITKFCQQLNTDLLTICSINSSPAGYNYRHTCITDMLQTVGQEGVKSVGHLSVDCGQFVGGQSAMSLLTGFPGSLSSLAPINILMRQGKSLQCCTSKDVDWFLTIFWSDFCFNWQIKVKERWRHSLHWDKFSALKGKGYSLFPLGCHWWAEIFSHILQTCHSFSQWLDFRTFSQFNSSVIVHDNDNKQCTGKQCLWSEVGDV